MVLTITGDKEVFERGSVDVESRHGVTFTVEVLQCSYGADVQLVDAVVTHVDVRQALECAEVHSLVGRQHQPVHSQVELFHVSHLGQRVHVQPLNLRYITASPASQLLLNGTSAHST